MEAWQLWQNSLSCPVVSNPSVLLGNESFGVIATQLKNPEWISMLIFHSLGQTRQKVIWAKSRRAGPLGCEALCVLLWSLLVPTPAVPNGRMGMLMQEAQEALIAAWWEG